MEATKDLRLAVLIDADNIPYTNVKEMMEEISKYGTPTFKRIYADWTKPHVAAGKMYCLRTPFLPCSNTAILPGKMQLTLQ